METNVIPLPLQTGQQVKKKPTKTHNYPKEPIVEYSEIGQSYTYDIIEEGYYPPAAYLKYTKDQGF